MITNNLKHIPGTTYYLDDKNVHNSHGCVLKIDDCERYTIMVNKQRISGRFEFFKWCIDNNVPPQNAPTWIEIRRMIKKKAKEKTKKKTKKQ